MIARTFAWFAILTSISVFVQCPDIEAQDEPFYFVDKERIPLHTSTRYHAFELERLGEYTGEISRFSSMENLDISPFLLEKYNLVLLPISDGMSPESAAGALDNVREDLTEIYGVASEPPVFSAYGAEQVLVNEFVVQFWSTVESEQSAVVLSEAGATILEVPERTPGRYVVTFSQMNEFGALEASNALHQNNFVEYSQPNFVRLLLRWPDSRRDRRENQARPCPSVFGPDDPYYSCQWALSNEGWVGVSDADIDANDAWELLENEGRWDVVVIAVIDEGVDTQHEDLAERIVDSYDATDRDDDQDPNPSDGHGTACAGIAAAISNNGLGVTGVDGEAQIMPIRIAVGGPGGSWITDDRTIADGLRVAVDRGANVLSNSWGGGSPSNLINSAIDYALAHERVVIFASGNNYGAVMYPANLSMTRPVIAVGATNEWDELKTPSSQDGEHWWGSNYGDAVTVVAPGVHIFTTDSSGSAGYHASDYYPAFNGTSSATPHVAGIAALMLSANPQLGPEDVRKILQATAEDLGDPGFDGFYGHSRVNAQRALSEVLSGR